MGLIGRIIRHRHRRHVIRALLLACAVMAGSYISSHRAARRVAAHRAAATAAVRGFATQAECESATGKKCGFVMCDYVPPGKTYEEVCGNTPKGWQPRQ